MVFDFTPLPVSISDNYQLLVVMRSSNYMYIFTLMAICILIYILILILIYYPLNQVEEPSITIFVHVVYRATVRLRVSNYYHYYNIMLFYPLSCHSHNGMIRLARCPNMKDMCMCCSVVVAYDSYRGDGSKTECSGAVGN